MHKYTQFGDSVFVADPDKRTILDTLPPNVYNLYFELGTGFYLKQTERFILPEKLYGTLGDKASRIINTFLERPDSSTGVLASGEKGSGKTLLAKVLSEQLLEKNIPTILVNTGFGGDSFNDFLQKIGSPYLLIMDEFEKIYDEEDQPRLLTMLDGTKSTHRLIILTCNNRYQVDKNMINRPGRLYYHLPFEGLDEDFIRDFCTDKLDNKDEIEPLMAVVDSLHPCNFDMLQCVVEEMNRYKESAIDSIKILNVTPDPYNRQWYHAELTFDGKPYTGFRVSKRAINENPYSPDLDSPVYFYRDITVKDKDIQNMDMLVEHFDFDPDEDASIRINLEHQDLIGYDQNTKKILFNTVYPKLGVSLEKEKVRRKRSTIWD